MSEEAVAICIPAMRPKNFERIVNNLEAVTVPPYSIYWMVTQDLAPELDRLQQTYWVDDGGHFAERHNYMFEHTQEPYLFLGADDLGWHPEWLQRAMQTMRSIDGVVSVCDMWQWGVGTAALVSRNYINTVGGCVDQPPGTLMFAGYPHHGAESELFETAAMRGRYAHCPESIVEHLHFILGKAEYDDAYKFMETLTEESVRIARSRRHLWAT